MAKYITLVGFMIIDHHVLPRIVSLTQSKVFHLQRYVKYKNI